MVGALCGEGGEDCRMKGMAGLCGRLEALAGELESVGVERARVCALRACDLARELAPVETGRLRGSIGARVAEFGAVLFAECEYAAAVELGSGRGPARPFLLPAARKSGGGM